MPRDPKEHAQYVRQYYATHKEKWLGRVKCYREANREKIAERGKQFREDNAELVKARKLVYCQANREKEAARARRWTAVNRERKRQTDKAYYEQHRGDFIARARKRQKSLQGVFTQADILRLYETQHKRCAGCAKPLRGNYEIDHVIPVSKGGSNSPENLELLCRACNRRKHSMMPEEWAARIGKLFV